MKKIVMSMVLITMLVIGQLPVYSAGYLSPAGTEEPAKVDGYYQVETPEQLKWIANSEPIITSNIRLMNDIDMSSLGNWFPIYQFNGTFDGQGYTIKNLTVKNSGYDIGFISELYGVVKNLNIENAVVEGDMFTGIIAGSNTGTITNCTVSGTVSGSSYVGGITGINNSIYYIPEEPKPEKDHAFVIDSGADVKVTGEYAVGGIVGANSGEISGCFAKGEVYGEDSVGGICGNGSNQKNCYSRADVYNILSYSDLDMTVEKDLEKLSKIGTITGNGTANSCYSTGQIVYALDISHHDLITRTNIIAGGVKTYSDGTENTNCYYDTDTSGYIFADTDPGVIGKTTLEMKSSEMADLLNAGGDGAWKQANIINDRYPILSWQTDTAVLENYTDKAVFTLKEVDYYNGTFMAVVDVADYSIEGECYLLVAVKDERGRLLKMETAKIWQNEEIFISTDLPENEAFVELFVWNPETLEAYTKKLVI